MTFTENLKLGYTVVSVLIINLGENFTVNFFCNIYNITIILGQNFVIQHVFTLKFQNFELIEFNE